MVLFFLANILCGQQGNPFDIKKRKDTSVTENVIKSNHSPASNIIEDTILNANSIPPENSISEETTPSNSTINPIPNADSNSNSESVPESESESVSVSFLEKRQQELIDANPFNVSHIPIKRNSKKNTTKVVSEPRIETQDVVPPVNVPEEDLSSNIENDEKSANEVTTQIIDEQTVEHILPDNITGISTNKFIFWLLFLQLLLITSLIGINRDFIPKISRSISNDNFAKLIARDYSNGYNALFIILYLIFVLSLSMYIYLSLRVFTGFNGFAKYLIILFSVGGVYVIRHIFQNVSGTIFPFKKESNYYDFMIILFNAFLGLILIPFNVIISYAPGTFTIIGVYGGLGIIIIFYLLRLLRGMLNAYTYARNYLFHFFLYLCTCEIAPLLILLTYMMRQG